MIIESIPPIIQQNICIKILDNDKILNPGLWLYKRSLIIFNAKGFELEYNQDSRMRNKTCKVVKKTKIQIGIGDFIPNQSSDLNSNRKTETPFKPLYKNIWIGFKSLVLSCSGTIQTKPKIWTMIQKYLKLLNLLIFIHLGNLDI